MTDRELLEKAAKAAGIDGHWGSGWESDYFFRTIPRPSSPLVSNVRWDPINDDSDALRLAVKLEIHIQPSGRYSWASTFSVNATEDATGDRYAATRRAIVRVAAQMAKDGE